MTIRRVTRKQFDEILQQCRKDGADVPDMLVPKGIASEIRQSDADKSKRVLEFIASTETVDRMGDTIALDGWDLKHFRKGGSMLWSHKYDLPIAAPTKVWKSDGNLKFRARFPDEETNAFADTIYKMYQGGFVKGTSVGFLPKKFEVAEDRGDANSWFPPLNFLEQELLEISGTPVPANPEALIEASKSIDMKSFYDWTEKSLDGEEDEDRFIYVPRETLESMRKQLAPQFKTVPKPTTTDADDPADPVEPEPTEPPAPSTEVWRGLTATMGAVLGVRSLTDLPEDERRELYEQLAKQYRDDFGKEPPGFDPAPVSGKNKGAGGGSPATPAPIPATEPEGDAEILSDDEITALIKETVVEAFEASNDNQFDDVVQDVIKEQMGIFRENVRKARGRLS